MEMYLYFGAIVGWCGLHGAVDVLRRFHFLSAFQLRFSRHCLQVIFLTAAGAYEFVVRPSLARVFTDLDLYWLQYLLVYGMPTGTALAVAALCVWIDVRHMYRVSVASDSSAILSWTHWVGLASCAFGPLILLHPLLTVIPHNPWRDGMW